MSIDQILDTKITKLTLFLSIPFTIIVAFVLVKVAPIYALVAALGLGVLIVTFTNTDFALYILIFSMLLSPEFGSRTTMGGGITIRIDDIILAIICFTWLAKTALNKQLTLFKETPLNKPIKLYLFVCIISTAFGMMMRRVQVLNGAFFIIKYVEYFMIYFMVVNQIQSKKQMDNYVISLLITFVIVSIVAIAQIPTGKRVTAPFEGDAGEPNTLGGYLILIIAINLNLILTPGILSKPKYRRWLLIITGFAVFPYLLTNSRGSWAAGIPVVIGYVLWSKRRWVIIGYAAALISIAPFILPDVVIDRVKYTFTPQKGYARSLQEEVGGITLDTSASERVRSWRSAFKDIKKHPLLGFGITGWRFLDAQYMRVLIETGVVGLFFFVYMLVQILKNTQKIYMNSQIPFLKTFAQGFYIATISMMTHSLGANTFIIIRIMEPFWFICGLVISIPNIEKIELEKLRLMEEKFTSVKIGT